MHILGTYSRHLLSTVQISQALQTPGAARSQHWSSIVFPASLHWGCLQKLIGTFTCAWGQCVKTGCEAHGTHLLTLYKEAHMCYSSATCHIPTDPTGIFNLQHLNDTTAPLPPPFHESKDTFPSRKTARTGAPHMVMSPPAWKCLSAHQGLICCASLCVPVCLRKKKLPPHFVIAKFFHASGQDSLKSVLD